MHSRIPSQPAFLQRSSLRIRDYLHVCPCLCVCMCVWCIYTDIHIIKSIASILALGFYVVMNIYTYLLCKILGLMSCIGMYFTVKP